MSTSVLVNFSYVGFSAEVEVSHNTEVQSIWYRAYTPFPLLLHLEHILPTELLLRHTLIFNNMRQGVSHRPSHFYPQMLLVFLYNLKYPWRYSWTVQFYHMEVFLGSSSWWNVLWERIQNKYAFLLDYCQIWSANPSG